MQDRRYEVDALERERYCAHDPKTDLELADERLRAQSRRRILDHIGPLNGKCFMSLNMSPAQMAVVGEAIARAGQKDPEQAIVLICKEWLERPLAI